MKCRYCAYTPDGLKMYNEEAKEAMLWAHEIGHEKEIDNIIDLLDDTTNKYLTSLKKISKERRRNEE